MEKNQQTAKQTWQAYLPIFIRLSSWIAFPVLAGVFLGKWLDKKYDTEPWLFLTAVGLAFVISIFGLVKNTISEFKKISPDDKKEDNKKINKYE